MRRPAVVFLDRDGTLNQKAPDGGYVRRAGDLQLLPGAGTAVRRLNEAGVRVLVVTNQRGVARGLMTEPDLDLVHARLEGLLRGYGAHLDGVYTCLHAESTCACRKPLPGLLLRAARERDLDLSQAVMVGDADSDVAAGQAAGVATIRLADRTDPRADATVGTLADAVDLLLGAVGAG